MDIKCYRVWFKDDSALLVDATSEAEATDLGSDLAREQSRGLYFLGNQVHLHLQVSHVECLSK